MGRPTQSATKRGRDVKLVLAGLDSSASDTSCLIPVQVEMKFHEVVEKELHPPPA